MQEVDLNLIELLIEQNNTIIEQNDKLIEYLYKYDRYIYCKGINGSMACKGKPKKPVVKPNGKSKKQSRM